MTPRTRPVLLLLAALWLASPHLGATAASGRTIAGWVEMVRFPESDLVVRAKLDTGARTSSIFAVNVRKFKKEGKDWVRFDLYLEDIRDEAHRITLEKPVLRKVRIKNHDGRHDPRPVIALDLCFDGRPYNTEFTLADRNEFIYNILLGRSFLDGVALVDSASQYQTSAECNSWAADPLSSPPDGGEATPGAAVTNTTSQLDFKRNAGRPGASPALP